jgi:Malectin domain
MLRTISQHLGKANAIPLLAMIFSLLGAAPASVVITPTVSPVVNQGTTFKFTANMPVTWSCPGCAGTIDADGTYHAPQTVTAKQSYGGYQVLPNNHIFNTRIDSLPVNPNSAAWIAGAGTVPLNYHASFPINYVNAATPAQSMLFLYTPGNNGTFEIPQYPDAKIEGGWFTFGTGVDRHFFAIDTRTGIFQEMYNFYSAGQNNSCATCTSQSGVRYANSTYDLPANGSTDAAGMYVMPLTLRAQEMEQAVATGGTINHALRFTLNAGYCASSFIWPATTMANDGGTVPFGARFRLKSSFNISTFSPAAQILLKQLQQYGIILADGGYGWQVTVEGTKWPASLNGPFGEVQNANIAPSNFEAVDESGLAVASSSGLTNTGETVVATSTANPSVSASMPVVLTGVTVNLQNDIQYFQAGVGPVQLTAMVHGGASNKVTWTINPQVGTLSSSGVYTPPATSTTLQATTITATSADNSSVAAQMTLAVYPNGTIRLVPAAASDYTDSKGNVWLHGLAGDGSYGYDNGGTWPNTADISLYKIPIYGNGGVDLRFDLVVPNGSYQITGKFAETQGFAPNYKIFSLESQGQIIDPNLDIYILAGGHNMPKDFIVPATVTSNRLSFVIRATGGTNMATDISALQIVPVSLSGTASPSAPQPPSNLNITNVK